LLPAARAVEDFRDAIEAGGARAVLASQFHDRVLTVGDVKRFLSAEGFRSDEPHSCDHP
jgi:imidazole glycerol phosphate synthase subunit HisF